MALGSASRSRQMGGIACRELVGAGAPGPDCQSECRPLAPLAVTPAGGSSTTRVAYGAFT